MPPLLDYTLVAATVIAACTYLFFTYRKKKCGGCMGGSSKATTKTIQIQLPKK